MALNNDGMRVGNEAEGFNAFILPTYCSNDSDEIDLPSTAIVVVDREFGEFLEHVRGLVKDNRVYALDFFDDHPRWSVKGVESTTCYVSADAVWWQAEINDTVVKTEEVAFSVLSKAA